MKKAIIIQASSRSEGDTNKIAMYLKQNDNFNFIDLKTKNIGHFDYDFKNADDDFLPIMDSILNNYDTLILLTPLYRFTMSGILKVFLDRFSDLKLYKKELGDKLKNKNMAMISVSNANNLPKGFSMPFKETANHFGMNYLGDLHTWLENGEINSHVKLLINDFTTNLKNN